VTPGFNRYIDPLLSETCPFPLLSGNGWHGRYYSHTTYSNIAERTVISVVNVV